MSTDFSVETVIHATRKARRCFWCPEPLPVGSEAVKVAGVWEGRFATLYTHPDCNVAWLRDPCNDEDEGCPYPHLRGKTCSEATDQQEGRLT